ETLCDMIGVEPCGSQPPGTTKTRPQFLVIDKHAEDGTSLEGVSRREETTRLVIAEEFSEGWQVACHNGDAVHHGLCGDSAEGLGARRAEHDIALGIRTAHVILS